MPKPNVQPMINLARVAKLAVEAAKRHLAEGDTAQAADAINVGVSLITELAGDLVSARDADIDTITIPPFPGSWPALQAAAA